ncbi:hypothetical protein ROLI_045850 (plasmid) [Roseobacter fucihabitans]|uniref:Uncharacterized protein n=1 Tax=Roseobacter fucihabitans TaxID=1537242 RepID=A0ABZ2BZV4_9RHOB|nr:hypothetical protein [Roseobacter litoralis]MBC6967598.1 hypothetical protein [Roseobacter litoralis]
MNTPEIVAIAMDYPIARTAQLALLISLPFTWWICRSLLRLSALPFGVLLPAIFTALLIVVYHLVGLVVGDFYGGVIWASAGLILVGAALRFGTTLARLTGRIVLGRGVLWMIIGATFLLLPAIFRFDFHDKAVDVFGHLTIINNMLNGFYPPRNPLASSFELPYHYGVNLMAALVATATHTAADRALDLLTLALWPYSLTLFAVLSAHLLKRETAPWWVVAVGAFAGGIPWIAESASLLSHKATLIFHVNDSYINPPLVSYFFQHPWTIGLPLGLGVLHIALPLGEREVALRPAFPILALFFVTLAISNVTVALTFSSVILGFFVIELFWRRDGAGERLSAGVLLVALTFLSITYISGFGELFKQTSQNSIVVADQGIAGGFWKNILWNVATFGLLLPLGIWGLFLLKRRGLILAGLAGGGFLILNVLKYEQSWDIVKFGTVAQIAFALAAVVALQLLFARLRLKTWGLLLILIAPGLSFSLAFFASLEGNPYAKRVRKGYVATAPILTEAEARAIHHIRRNIADGELVVVPHPNSVKYSLYGGLPQFDPTGGNVHVFLDDEDIQVRRLLMQEANPKLSDMTEAGAAWFVRNRETPEYTIEDDAEDYDIKVVLNTGRLEVLQAVAVP